MLSQTVLGVCHHEWHLAPVFSALEQLSPDRTWLAFLEPSADLLEGRTPFLNESTARFFSSAGQWFKQRGIPILSLNFTHGPSQRAVHLLDKFCAELAEEEYAASVCRETLAGTSAVLICGDVHAPRLARLINARYVRAGPLLPSTIFAHNWRDVLEGREQRLLDVRWLEAAHSLFPGVEWSIEFLERFKSDAPRCEDYFRSPSPIFTRDILRIKDAALISLMSSPTVPRPIANLNPHA